MPASPRGRRDARGRPLHVAQDRRLDPAGERALRAWFKRHGTMPAGGRWAMRLAIATFPLTMCLLPIAPGAWWVIVLLAIVATAVLGWIAFASFCRQMIRALVGTGRCGACGYPLSELPRGDDGLVACPECGAAWDVE